MVRVAATAAPPRQAGSPPRKLLVAGLEVGLEPPRGVVSGLVLGLLPVLHGRVGFG